MEKIYKLNYGPKIKEIAIEFEGKFGQIKLRNMIIKKRKRIRIENNEKDFYINNYDSDSESDSDYSESFESKRKKQTSRYV